MPFLEQLKNCTWDLLHTFKFDAPILSIFAVEYLYQMYNELTECMPGKIVTKLEERYTQ